MAVRITLECGNLVSVRSKTTPEGYTHDWEVFVRGVDDADIHHYIDRGTIYFSIFNYVFTLIMTYFSILSGFSPS